jgi:hypothetical protein
VACGLNESKNFISLRLTFYEIRRKDARLIRRRQLIVKGKIVFHARFISIS